MAFSAKQREYLNNANRRWNFKTGATRSGKTYLDYFVIPKRIRARIGLPGLAVILGVTKSTIERNILEPMRNIWGSQMVGEINSQNICYMFGEYVYCLGAEKISQVSKLRGASIKYVYGDEVADWNEEVFEMLKSRLDKPYSCFDGALNPQGPSHWLKGFLENEEFDIYCQKYTIFDNPFLPSEFVKNLCKEYAGTVYYARYILGEWALAEGLVYPFDKDRHTAKELPPPELVKRYPRERPEDIMRNHGEWYISCDYGTLNPFSAGLWWVFEGKAYRVAEYYYSGRNSSVMKTDEEYYAQLEKLAGDWDIRSVVVDPSAASFIATIRQHGRFAVRKARNDVLNGIRLTAAMLNAGVIQIGEGCKDAIREFGLYRWEEKGEVDKPIKENDHAMDDIRYFCSTVMRRDSFARSILGGICDD